MSAVVVFIIFVVCLVIAIPVSIALGIASVLPGAFDPSFTASGQFEFFCKIHPTKGLKKTPETVYNITDYRYSPPFYADQTVSVFGISENQTEGNYYGRTVKHDAPRQTVQAANEQEDGWCHSGI